MQKMRPLYVTYRYELIAALIGASIMILELVGARLIAPYFGTSLYVWTAVIGVILGAIAIGEMLGGRWADKQPSDKRLAEIITVSAAILLVTQLVQQEVLQLVESLPFDVRLEALVAALLLFAPVNFFLGVVSPYLAKLKLTTLTTVGQSVGALYGAGTIGSILGTFLAGYYLLSFVGSRPLGVAMVAVLLGVSFLAHTRTYRLHRTALAVIALLVAMAVNYPSGMVRYDADSAYARYQVVDVDRGWGQTERQLRTDAFGAHSAVHVESPQALIIPYNQLFLQVATGSRESKSALLIGGGAFTLPRALVAVDKDIAVDVVEIDPKLEEISKRYFFFEDHRRIRVVNEDGRVYLNNNTTTYDLIFMDAYNSLTPPFQLTTQETVECIYSGLADNGAVAVNLISAVEGKDAEFLRATVATYRSRFPLVEVYRTTATPFDQKQNLVIYAAKQANRPSGIGNLPVPPIATTEADILTDDFAPVERITQR